LDGGRKDGFGERDMWKKWQKLKSHMKKMMSNLPNNYHKMKSGTQPIRFIVMLSGIIGGLTT
jgi:hypothetical protein